MASPTPQNLRSLPSVSRLLADPALLKIEQAARAQAVKNVLRQERERMQQSGEDCLSIEALALKAAAEAEKLFLPALRPAINASGVVLHTGLGRARLAPAAAMAAYQAALHHAVTELNVQNGKRGDRQEHVRPLLCSLTGAESALVVNNCAGAVLLAITVLAQGREVLLSRGQLVEIGGSFRMPDIIESSGAVLKEVGATNRTRLADYRKAVTEHTALILRCHPSNFSMHGFVEETPLAQLAALGKETGIPVMDDQGNGALQSVPAGEAGLLPASAACCDVVTASGDKLLGGPQAGLILGKGELVQQMAAHPLARCLRVDKMTLAALEATLRIYHSRQLALQQIPTLRYLHRSEDELRAMALSLRRMLNRALRSKPFLVEIVPEYSAVGGGSLPDEKLPTFCVSVKGKEKDWSAENAAAKLRGAAVPVIARIRSNALLLDPRTLEQSEFAAIVQAVSCW